ncbi:MAG: MOSC domain-containing protein [Verrucomicrobia bacterium]|nr:MAG: MOSC domain-containing protein [Verrucomicrobiota bacterium]
MKLLSIQVSLPQEVQWQGRTVTTGIFKEPVEGPVMLRTLNLIGDAQADLSVHGGPTRAVYACPVEHYQHWRREFPDMDLPPGMFGENFTIEGLLETNVNIGDRFRIGSAEIMAAAPRLPCYKLGIKFGRSDILKKLLTTRYTGFYCSVLREGEVRAGDNIERLDRDETAVSVDEIVRLYASPDMTILQRAIETKSLPNSWRDYFRQQLDKVNANHERNVT